MGKILAATLAVLAVLSGVLAIGVVIPEPADQGSMTIWEAYSRGLVAIKQVDITYTIGQQTDTAALGYEVRSTSTGSVLINEHVMLMSPSPRQGFVGTTTQDGILSFATVPPSSTTTYGYGDFVAQGILTMPPWFCTEERQFVKAEVGVALGGELAPTALNSILANLSPNPGGTQDILWAYLRDNPSPVVGKTVNDAFWDEIPETAGQSLHVVLRATNVAVADGTDLIPEPNAPSARVWDKIPPGYTVDPASILPTGYNLNVNPDGSTTLSWIANLPAADVTNKPADDQPTPYVSRNFQYTMTTPRLTPGRAALPRASVSATDDPTAEAMSAQPVIDVLRVQMPPVADAGAGYRGVEGDTISFSAAGSTDPNGDALQYRWDFTADGTWDTAWSSDPSDPTATATFGDDVSGTVRVEVSDGEATSTDEAPVIVTNVDATIDDLDVAAVGNLTLRVAGEKWHDVRLEMTQGGVTQTISIVRTPGSPDRQASSLTDVTIDLSEDVSLTVYYTPDDDPVNGQPQGANPVWVIFDSGDGEVRLHHTFNVNHPDTWVWTLDDIVPQLIGLGLRVHVVGSDVGSDDLTFVVDFGDGTSASETVYNDGAAPDPMPSPSVNPITASATFSTAFASAGTYTITVLVRDDDGGTATRSLTVSVG